MEKNQSHSKKDKTFTFRISEGDKQILDNISSDSNRPLSSFMRNAMRNYIYMFYINPKLGNPQIVFSKNIIAKIFSYLNEEQIDEISKLAFNNAMNSFEKFKRLIDLEPFSVYNATTFTDFLDKIEKHVYSSNAQNWLESFDYKINGIDMITVFGAHNLGENFSIFFKSTQSLHAKYYGYKLKSFKFFKKKNSRTDPMEKDHFIIKYIKNNE
ncbi:MAG: hypothetical protein ACTSWX_10905 [Promethearchaeota archaeon]